MVAALPERGLCGVCPWPIEDGEGEYGTELPIARSVVVGRHKGSLSFESEVGKGTTFYVRLPIAPEPSEEGKP